MNTHVDTHLGEECNIKCKIEHDSKYGDAYVILTFESCITDAVNIYLSPKRAIEVWKKLGKLKLIGEEDAKH